MTTLKQPECKEDLKVGQQVKTKKPHKTIVNGVIEFRCLPKITMPQEIHGEISYVSNFKGEFHVKWTELKVETIEHFNSQTSEWMELE